MKTRTKLPNKIWIRSGPGADLLRHFFSANWNADHEGGFAETESCMKPEEPRGDMVHRQNHVMNHDKCFGNNQNKEEQETEKTQEEH